MIEGFFSWRPFDLLLDKICIGEKFRHGPAPVDLPFAAINRVLYLGCRQPVKAAGLRNPQLIRGPPIARGAQRGGVEADAIPSLSGAASAITKRQANSISRLPRHDPNRHAQAAPLQGKLDDLACAESQLLSQR